MVMFETHTATALPNKKQQLPQNGRGDVLGGQSIMWGNQNRHKKISWLQVRMGGPVCYNTAVVKPIFLERRGRITELDRSFDLAYWQAQPAEARFQATWELILHYARLKGLDLGPGGARLLMQRSVETFQKQQRQLPDNRALC